MKLYNNSCNRQIILRRVNKQWYKRFHIKESLVEVNKQEGIYRLPNIKITDRYEEKIEEEEEHKKARKE